MPLINPPPPGFNTAPPPPTLLHTSPRPLPASPGPALLPASAPPRPSRLASPLPRLCARVPSGPRATAAPSRRAPSRLTLSRSPPVPRTRLLSRRHATTSPSRPTTGFRAPPPLSVRIHVRDTRTRLPLPFTPRPPPSPKTTDAASTIEAPDLDWQHPPKPRRLAAPILPSAAKPTTPSSACAGRLAKEEIYAPASRPSPSAGHAQRGPPRRARKFELELDADVALEEDGDEGDEPNDNHDSSNSTEAATSCTTHAASIKRPRGGSASAHGFSTTSPIHTATPPPSASSRPSSASSASGERGVGRPREAGVAQDLALWAPAYLWASLAWPAAMMGARTRMGEAGGRVATAPLFSPLPTSHAPPTPLPRSPVGAHTAAAPSSHVLPRASCSASAVPASAYLPSSPVLVSTSASAGYSPTSGTMLGCDDVGDSSTSNSVKWASFSTGGRLRAGLSAPALCVAALQSVTRGALGTLAPSMQTMPNPWLYTTPLVHRKVRRHHHRLQLRLRGHPPSWPRMARPARLSRYRHTAPSPTPASASSAPAPCTPAPPPTLGRHARSRPASPLHRPRVLVPPCPPRRSVPSCRAPPVPSRPTPRRPPPAPLLHTRVLSHRHAAAGPSPRFTPLPTPRRPLCPCPPLALTCPLDAWNVRKEANTHRREAQRLHRVLSSQVAVEGDAKSTLEANLEAKRCRERDGGHAHPVPPPSPRAAPAKDGDLELLMQRLHRMNGIPDMLPVLHPLRRPARHRPPHAGALREPDEVEPIPAPRRHVQRGHPAPVPFLRRLSPEPARTAPHTPLSPHAAAASYPRPATVFTAYKRDVASTTIRHEADPRPAFDALSPLLATPDTRVARGGRVRSRADALHSATSQRYVWRHVRERVDRCPHSPAPSTSLRLPAPNDCVTQRRRLCGSAG
ncbi:hypothetical protein B0H14DRAFT_3468137 [Mycena olivaceomarginata]|nr:hypothetical protein B0H14DRAFT_3468137 [Mycena olivaceomarginata]